MEWITKTSSFKYNGIPVTRSKIVATTPIIKFVVYESLGGRCFYYTNKMINRRDPFNEISPQPTIPCGTLAAGKLLCELYWLELKEKINQC